jgi:hypothetical protein
MLKTPRIDDHPLVAFCCLQSVPHISSGRDSWVQVAETPAAERFACRFPLRLIIVAGNGTDTDGASYQERTY